jgi:hypothetical protein
MRREPPRRGARSRPRPRIRQRLGEKPQVRGVTAAERAMRTRPPGPFHPRSKMPALAAPPAVSSLRICEWVLSGHRNTCLAAIGLTGGGVSQDIGMAWPARSGDVEGASCHHCCCHRAPVAGRGSPRIRRVPGLGVPAGRPVPGRGRGGVRAAVPAAEDLPGRDQRRHRGADHQAAQGTGRAGTGRRPGHDLLAPAPPSSGQRRSGDGLPVPDAGRAGDTRAEETARSPPTSGSLPSSRTSAGNRTSPATPWPTGPAPRF